MDQSTLNPLDERLTRVQGSTGYMWQIFATNVMVKPLQATFSRKGSTPKEHQDSQECRACVELARVVLVKYRDFERAMHSEVADVEADPHNASNRRTRSPGPRDSRSRKRMGADEVNNAFFAWQLTHDSEQTDEQGQQQWPELYAESKEFKELKQLLKLACLEYLQQVYDASLTVQDLAHFDLSIWASVTPSAHRSEATQESDAKSMGLAFHDHPLALLSGVFYAQAGGRRLVDRTPTVFADPRGTPVFRYTRQQRQGKHREGSGRGYSGSESERPAGEDSLEPTAPFHRLAYAHASDGIALIFPPWLVHGVPPHTGASTRVAFAFNLHTSPGTTLSSWAKTTL